MAHFISADRIHNGRAFLPEGTALALDSEGRVEDILQLKNLEPGNVKVYEGILCPGFVNAHCHLELSHMKGRIAQHTGLVDFALNIIQTRNNGTSPEEIKEQAAEADRQMWRNGIVAVGDICNTGDTISVKAESPIHYHSFVELIALNPARAEQVFAGGLQLQQQYKQAGLEATIVPHAPYTVSFRLMEMIARENAITSIHNQESMQEDLLYKKKAGDFLTLYSTLNIPIDYFEPTGKSSLQSYLPHLKNSQNLLLVHDTFTNEEDLAFAKTISNQLYWCLCPNANLYIENALPRLSVFEAAGSRLCLGTDSLASNHTLSVADEMQVIRQHFPQTDVQDLLTWATYNGALALGLGHRFGTIEKNMAPGINLLVQGAGGLSVTKLH